MLTEKETKLCRIQASIGSCWLAISHATESAAELPSGSSVCNLRIACNGIKRRRCRRVPGAGAALLHVATFGGLAESVARYMDCGSLVAVDGRLDWRGVGTRRESSYGKPPEAPRGERGWLKTVQFLDRPATRGEGDRSRGSDGPDTARRCRRGRDRPGVRGDQVSKTVLRGKTMRAAAGCPVFGASRLSRRCRRCPAACRSVFCV